MLILSLAGIAPRCIKSTIFAGPLHPFTEMPRLSYEPREK
jgi:hypothetical protein